MNRFDLIVIGCGPAGERAAVTAARAGHSTAVVERAHVMGGTCVNWGTIPSKTLRESALFVYSLTRHRLHGIRATVPSDITVADFMSRERVVVQRELEFINALLAHPRIEIFQAQARFLDTHTVMLIGNDGQQRAQLEGDVIVVATGSTPNRPPELVFDGETVFDSDTILTLPRMPRSMVVMGAGVIGVEYAAIFAALGLDVTLVDTRAELLPYLDREIADILERELIRLGIILLHNDRLASLERLPGPQVRCRTEAGNLIEADVLLYCVGRDGNTLDLGLEMIGMASNARGLIEVNEHYQTIHSHIYAVGDVIGYPALASTSMEQGRQAVRHAFGIPGMRGRTERLPFAIYSIPEVSFVGESEAALRQRGQTYVVGRGRYAYNARAQIIDDEGGLLKLLFDARELRLLGVHLVGTGASELVHIGQAFLSSQATAFDICETIYNYPTLSDVYRHAALEAVKLRR